MCRLIRVRFSVHPNDAEGVERFVHQHDSVLRLEDLESEGRVHLPGNARQETMRLRIIG